QGLVSSMHKEPDPPDREEDRELVRRAAEGDEAAFETLVRRKRERVYWIAFRIIGDQEQAREIAQATFIRLWRSLAKYDPAQNFDTWLYRVTVNLAIDRYRSRGPARAFLPLEGGPGEPGEETHADTRTEGPFEALRGAELARIFESLASRLGEKQ